MTTTGHHEPEDHDRGLAFDRRRLLSRIRERVNPDLEIAAVTDRVCKLPGGGPGLLFEQPAGFDIPVATNLFGSIERMCLALGTPSLDAVAREIDEMMTPDSSPAPTTS